MYEISVFSEESCRNHKYFLMKVKLFEAKPINRGIEHLVSVITHKLSVIRQKGKSQNGCFKKAKHSKISEKQTFLSS